MKLLLSNKVKSQMLVNSTNTLNVFGLLGDLFVSMYLNPFDAKNIAKFFESFFGFLQYKSISLITSL